MKYLQSSFSIAAPEQVFGCAACIYGEKHGYLHTCKKPCPHGDPLCPCQDGDLCHYEGPNPMPAPAEPFTCDECGFATTDGAAMFSHCCQ